MLVLTRKSEEKIIIGKKDPIVITVLKISGGKVSLGIEAHPEYEILREELYNNKKNKADRKDNTEEKVDMVHEPITSHS
jgi:carbon storage regulator